MHAPAAATPRPHGRTQGPPSHQRSVASATCRFSDLCRTRRPGLWQRCSLQAAHAMDPTNWPDPVTQPTTLVVALQALAIDQVSVRSTGSGPTCSLGLRLPTLPQHPAPTRDHAPNRPARRRLEPAAGPPPLRGGAVAGLAGGLPAPAGPLRAP